MLRVFASVNCQFIESATFVAQSASACVSTVDYYNVAMRNRYFIGLWITLAVMVLAVGSIGLADETTDSATWLLKKATLIHPNGRHNVLLRALRQLRDPAMQPLFSALVQKRHPVLKIHGILGLSEIASPEKIDLALVADLKDPATQAQLVSSALTADLMDLDQCKQLAAWPGLDPAVKMIVAAKLLSEHQLKDEAFLDKAVESKIEAMRAMAGMLRMQLGHADGVKQLNELDKSDKPNRDSIRVMLLQTAIKYKFKTAADWAIKLATNPDSNKGLAYFSLRAAIKLDHPKAVNTWIQTYTSTKSIADRIRLAVLALDLAKQLKPAVFDLLIKDDLPLIQQIGRIGQLHLQGKPATGKSSRLAAGMPGYCQKKYITVLL